MEVLKNFIVLEGIDGSGTTTLQSRLSQYLQSNDIDPLCSCEPSDGPIGRLIRQALASKVQITSHSLAMLFAADRQEHLYNNGVVSQAESHLVLSDRYFFSSLAYQVMDCGWDYVYKLNCDFPLPEKMIFLDISADEAAQRRENRGGQEEIYERNDLQDRIIKGYHDVLDFFSDTEMKTLRLDGSKSPEELCLLAGEFILN